MKETITDKSRFPVMYEIFVWAIYTCLYKYAYYADKVGIPNDSRENLPHLQVLLYAFVLTLYIIPFYRWLIPEFLRNKKYGWLVVATIVFLWIGPKMSNWLVSYIFFHFSQDGALKNFYTQEYLNYHYQAIHFAGWDLRILFTDFVAFSSVAAIRFAFENEQRKRFLERDNLLLQLESLKAQLNPHFLFNTLNSIYGMSITGSKETPQFILRLSDMMRYILYDCRQNKVMVEKDVEFLQNYFEMEKKRYPGADIQLVVNGSTSSAIAPLLLIPFAENSFKHGAHRLNDKGFVHANLLIGDKELKFEITNDVFHLVKDNEKYGGVGIENVKKRLALYYPDQHELIITNDKQEYKIKLKISLK